MSNADPQWHCFSPTCISNLMVPEGLASPTLLFSSLEGGLGFGFWCTVEKLFEEALAALDTSSGLNLLSHYWC